MEATLKSLGFTLEAEQPHISGERFLMAKNKQVLVGHDKTGRHVVIKVSTVPEGQEDISREKKARDMLSSLSFALDNILFPEEIFFGKKDGYLIWAIEYIEQEKVFVEYTLEEQFFLILRAFEAQEAFHATTFEHEKKVQSLFPILHAQEYFAEFEKFEVEGLETAHQFLLTHKTLIDKYCNYLTHTDFVPHNFRVRNRKIYMLDCSPEIRTVHFGNKYEGWARFLNYMTIHNPKLEKLLEEYIRKNRGEEEYQVLRLMRVYKLGFILDFYQKSLAKTEGDLKELTLERLDFWREVLKYVLADQEMPEGFIEDYKKKRDSLRSEDEKRRQKEFAVA
jgi:hypothetical protein